MTSEIDISFFGWDQQKRCIRLRTTRFVVLVQFSKTETTGVCWVSLQMKIHDHRRINPDMLHHRLERWNPDRPIAHFLDSERQVPVRRECHEAIYVGVFVAMRIREHLRQGVGRP